MNSKPKPGKPVAGLTKASANLNIRCQPHELASWRKHATAKGELLSRFVVITLNAKVRQEGGEVS